MEIKTMKIESFWKIGTLNFNKKHRVNNKNYDLFLKKKRLENRVHFSEFNDKVGFSTFDIYPKKTCPNCTGLCSTFCYGNGMISKSLAYKLCVTINTEIVKNDLQEFRKQAIRFFSTYTMPYFRIHSNGDFFSQEYYDTWLEIISIFPHIKFLAFTKSYTLDLQIDSLPENFSLVYSVFPDSKVILDDLPLSYAIFPNNSKFSDNMYHYADYSSIENDTIECLGDCQKCLVCWSLAKRKINVRFHVHGTAFNVYKSLGLLTYPI